MVKLGMVGLGRIGKNHALNLHAHPGCEIVAVCSLLEDELLWAEQHLQPQALYKDYSNFLEHADMDAVFLATSSKVHAEQIIAAAQADKHIFCEKPLATHLAQCLKVKKAFEQLNYKKCFMLGFMRRFDPAYRFAKERIDRGELGQVYMVRSQTADHHSFAAFQLDFIKTAGGIFHDMSVHDIDTVRWFLDAEIESAYALSNSLVEPEFAKLGDADNAFVSCRCSDGKLALIQAHRNSAHGHDTFSEIYASKGSLRIGFQPAWSDVEIRDEHGVRKECVRTFFDRFNQAFAVEVDAFIDCIANKKPSPISIEDGIASTLAAETFTQSLKKKREVLVKEILEQLATKLVI